MLKQEIEERSLPLWHTPTQSLPVTETQATPSSLSRADAEQVLELAARLQSGEQDDLSIAEIEALGAQRGIAAHHVRQALAMRHRRAALPLLLTPVRLTRRQWQVSFLVVLLYWLFVTVLPQYFPAVAVLMGIIPLLLSVALGAHLRYKRAGIVAGAALMFATLLGMGLIMAVSQGPETVWRLFSEGMFITLLVYMAVGAMGAALRQWVNDQQPVYMSTVIKASRSDR